MSWRDGVCVLIAPPDPWRSVAGGRSAIRPSDGSRHRTCGSGDPDGRRLSSSATDGAARRAPARPSKDTLLRALKHSVRHRACATPVRVVGIDDWSWRKGATYGTIMVDLERREVLDILPDRSAESTSNWLRRHPSIEMVSRDRCGLSLQVDGVTALTNLIAGFANGLRRFRERDLCTGRSRDFH